MKLNIYISILFLTVFSCHSQTKRNSSQIIGGPCEGCEAIFEYDNRRLSNIDTLPKYKKSEPKIKITGVVYDKNKKTPAENVIIYIYHTNRDGIYETKGNEKGWAKRHGYIRGWVKTDKNGEYTFFTFRPSAYPNRNEPEHIHMIVKEPDKNEYYIDDVLFTDDRLLTDSIKNRIKNRGGTGIVTPVFENGVYTIKRDIILGLNIPNYD